MTIHDRDSIPSATDKPETASSQQGCEQLPANKSKAAENQRAIDNATAEIDRLENELRALRA